MADLENFCHDGRERGDGDQSLLGLDLFGRQKQHPQADTADVDHAREIKHQRRACRRTGQQMRRQRSFEFLGMRMVEPPTHLQHPC